MNEEQFNEIAQAVFALRLAFIRAGMRPPKSIELASRKDGDFFRHYSPKDMVVFVPRQAQGAEWCGTIMGVEVRMPGQWREHPGGDRRFV